MEEVKSIAKLLVAIGPTAVIFTGLTVAFVSYRLQLRSQRQRDDEAARRLASALLGEIASIREHITQFRYIPFYRRLRELFRKDQNALVPPRNHTGGYFVVYSSNAMNLGLLPDASPGPGVVHLRQVHRHNGGLANDHLAGME